MFKNVLHILAAFLLFFLLGCEEKPIPIPELSVGKRKVLVEELTGVKCQNCPDGAATLNNLGTLYGENLIVVSIHSAGNLSAPYPESNYDFQTASGTELANFIGSPLGYPSASINRRLVPPETDIYLTPNYWTGIIAEELKKAPAIGVYVETKFEPVSRLLDIDINLAAEYALTGEHRITVIITQDSIQDVQLHGIVKVPDYMHRHVFRTVLTQPAGDVIAEQLTSTNVVQKSYSTTLPADWDEEHCNVVAFVHHGTTPDKEILQAVEEHVIK